MRNILVAVDFSQLSERAIEEAASLAHRFSAKLCLLHVAAPDPAFVGYEAGPDSVRDSRAAELLHEHTAIHKRSAELRERGIDAKGMLVSGPTIDTIIAEARRHQADLLVLGSHGHGALYRALIGSVAEGVLRRATCPVLIIPAQRGDG